MKMKNYRFAENILKKFHGVRASHRDKHILWRSLNDHEFRLFELLVDLADWDIKHGEDNYGVVKYPNSEICKILAWSEPKTSRWLRKLLENKDLLVREQRGFLKVINFDQFEIKKALERKKKIKLILKERVS